MKEILKSLNSVAGVKGSMVVTLDGIVIAADFRGSLDEETVAAVSASFLKAAQEHAQKIGFKQFSRLVLEGTHGKVVLVPTGVAFLVVIADMKMNLEASFIEILSAARHVEAHGKALAGAVARKRTLPSVGAGE
jgi:predicted regulator of Ras-like GTPase activity (Roadblock/LC7/MglB family)